MVLPVMAKIAKYQLVSTLACKLEKK